MGYDQDVSVLDLARFHAKQAGLQNLLSFQQRDVSQLSSKYKYGYLITNPPYGERLADQNEAEALYRIMGKVFSRLDTWSIYIICSHPRFEELFQRKAHKKRKLYNGRIQCNYFQFFGPKPEQLQGPFALSEQ
ncbi:MAG TPA: class I SAM-dependent RNA methyltransferase, partial [Syntrophomonas sp.]|nr:class I SAM-dependent RNA methyltransferase [Syntrophomonas sp.]